MRPAFQVRARRTKLCSRTAVYNTLGIMANIPVSTASMKHLDREARLGALAEKSSYVENILTHAFVADLSSWVWRYDPYASLQVSRAEVDDSGFDLVLTHGATVRHIQLKQAHAEKTPRAFSVRVSFATIPGACVVVLSHALSDLRLMSYGYYGDSPVRPMPYIEAERTTKKPGHRTKGGSPKLRLNYRDVPYSRFKRGLTAVALLNELFPGEGNYHYSVEELWV